MPTDYLYHYSEKTNKGQTVGFTVELLAIHSSNIHQPGMFYEEQLCEGEGFGWFVYKLNCFTSAQAIKKKVSGSNKFFCL